MAQMVEMTINKVQVGTRRDDDAGVFVGFCPRFQVYSQGETKDEAVAAVTSAICLRLATAFDHGRIDTILRKAGFERIAGGVVPSTDEEFVSLDFKEGVEVSEIGIRVPLGALLHSRSAECRL